MLLPAVPGKSGYTSVVRRRSFKSVSVFFILLAVSLISGCNSGKKENAELDTLAEESVIPVSLISASTEDFSITGEYYGRVEPSEMAVLSVPAGGRVERITAREGDSVKKGVSLARIDADRIEEKVRLAEQSEIIAKDTYLRQKELFEKGSVAKLSMDQSKLQWLNALTAYTDARKLLDGALCISPLDGIVLNRYVEIYDEIAPGRPSFAVGNIDTLVARIGIPESEIGSVEEGTEVTLTFASYPDIVEKGVLSRLSRHTSDRSITFEGIVEFKNTTGTILPGVTSRITLSRNTMKEVITLPLEAVLNTAQGSTVMIEKNGKASETKVSLGPTDGKRVVIESGIISGDKVILGGNHVVSNGRPVQPLVQ